MYLPLKYYINREIIKHLCEATDQDLVYSFHYILSLNCKTHCLMLLGAPPL